jgi:hypothetical protein
MIVSALASARLDRLKSITKKSSSPRTFDFDNHYDRAFFMLSEQQRGYLYPSFMIMHLNDFYAIDVLRSTLYEYY